ncbi:hypothetical protein AVEN_235969-1 [Araneus ventricosus]|uniref:Uncharacterized protein n=1 Tax=Araneus ventricosus TaxID=182803 RepID=A0A4Y2KBE4_ARAVE|nr:hypothetical protein AVEN_235969-1 [Araneus ventricosus]
MGLEVDNNDIDELVEEHSQELTTEKRLWSCILLHSKKYWRRVCLETMPVFNEIVSLAKIMGLEVENNDIDELVDKHSQELTTE